MGFAGEAAGTGAGAGSSAAEDGGLAASVSATATATWVSVRRARIRCIRGLRWGFYRLGGTVRPRGSGAGSGQADRGSGDVPLRRILVVPLLPDGAEHAARPRM